ncbi:MAG: site-specific integrase [Candidatus Kapaibacterium sp.]|nr:site-specific integrase [Ignavibacteria bacterium]
MKISFFLKYPAKRNGECGIFAYSRLGKGQLQIYFPHLSIHPNQWSKKKQQVKPSVRIATDVNDALHRIENDLKAIIASLVQERIEPTPELVKGRFQLLTVKDATHTGKKTFLEYFDDWQTESKNRIKDSTLRVYKTTYKHLKAFSEARGRTLTFDGMDESFVNEFTNYLLKVGGLQDCTIERNRKTWKTFMKWAYDRGLTTNNYFTRVPKIKPAESIPERLTREELKAMSDADLSDSPPLDNARNLFVLQCCTGVRFGDLQKIVSNPAAYRKGDALQLTTQKTGKVVTIPLLPGAKAILERKNPPHSISNQKMNKYLKEVAKRAGLDRTVLIEEEKGKRRTVKTKPLHDYIRTHDAKRTFVSLMADKGVSREVIRAITGNTNKTLDRYLRLDEREIQRELNKVSNLLGG